MKKVFFSFMAAFASIFAVNAQSQSNYCGSSKFFDNTSVGIVGGVETNLHDWKAPQGAVAGIVLNKEITPILGITLEGNTNINGLANWLTGDNRHVHCGNTFDGIAAYITGRVNLSNAIWGYKGAPRKFEIETNTGVGYGKAWHSDGHNSYDALLVKLGFNLNYNFAKAWTVTLRPAVVYDVTSNKQFNVNNAVGQITAGVVYHFKSSNGTHSFKKAKLYNQSEIDALNGKVNALQCSLNDANEQIKSLKESSSKVDTVFVESAASLGNVVSFKINSATVDETQMANLDNAAMQLVNDSTAKVTLKGYADKKTGSVTYNQKLSENRAKAVKDILVKKYGIDANRVNILGVGGTEQLYSDNNWNRVVIFVVDK